MLAAVFAAGEGAALSHDPRPSCGRLSASPFAHRCRRPTRRTIDGVRVHRCTQLDPRDIVVYKGIPVTTVARMLVDLTDDLVAEELANVIHEAAYRGRFSLKATRDAMTRANGRHNLGVLEAAIDLWLKGSAGLKSRPEAAFLSMLKLTDLPAPRVNTTVLGEEVDFHWPDRRLIVEVDGPGHRRPRTKREDQRRDRELQANGWTVLRYTADEIEQRPDDVMRRLSGYEGSSDA